MALPIGFYKFHKNKFLNYQLNRWHSLGYARIEDIETIGAKVKSFDDYISEFMGASKKALHENRLKHASTYLRAAEFLMSPNDPRKQPVYQEFIELFDLAFENEPFERHLIPYQNTYLSAIKFPCRTQEKKGSIIGIPGFDALIEEFYAIWNYFTYQGYDVIAFEGPGQGGSLRNYGLLFDHDYEKPAKAVLDYFHLDDVTALGVSMGGYWIMRAAAFERRIRRVIAMPPVYDWLEMTNPLNKNIAKWLLKHRKISNFLIRLKMNIPILKHSIQHALFIQNKHEPYDAIKWMMAMNKEHISSERISQDVLLLGGQNDAFQPPVLLEKQKQALIHAHSITQRVFLKSELADQHCQIGNVGLALETMAEWLAEKVKQERNLISGQ